MRLVALAVLALATRTAAAQPGMFAPAPAPLPSPMSAAALDETRAFWLSAGGTVASWTLVVAASSTELPSSSRGTIATVAALGTLFAPSFGHWYAHSFASRGLGLRAMGAGTAAVGFAIALSDHRDGPPLLPVGLVLAGAGLYLGGTLDDIVNAPVAVRRYNLRLQGLALAPLVGHSTGLAVIGRF